MGRRGKEEERLEGGGVGGGGGEKERREGIKLMKSWVWNTVYIPVQFEEGILIIRYEDQILTPSGEFQTDQDPSSTLLTWHIVVIVVAVVIVLTVILASLIIIVSLTHITFKTSMP